MSAVRTIFDGCEHKVFDVSNDGTRRTIMRECKRRAHYGLRHESGETFLCAQHYEMQARIRATLTNVTTRGDDNG